MTKKQKYRTLCEQESTIPIFSQAWWLDAVSGDNWDVVLVEKGGIIQASMPYLPRKRFGLTTISQPVLTQNLGPWLRPSSAKYAKQLSQEKELLQALFAKLPPHANYSQNWHFSRTNWLPLYWKGYQQTTRYTYVIEDISNLEKVFSEFEHSKRKNIKKSESLIKIVYDISAEEFYENHKMTLKKQGAEISYSFPTFKKIYDEGYRRNQVRTIAAYDADANLHAALFVVWDKMSAYDLISTIDPDYRVFGAASVLVREMIQYTSGFVNKFDFEGSMIESVERSFRQFGAKQIPYFSVSKINSNLLKTYRFFQDLRR